MKCQKIKNPLILTLLPVSFFLLPSLGFADPVRSVRILSLEPEGANHLQLRATATEEEGDGHYPITTLDKNSFQILIDGKSAENTNLSLTTFDTTRRLNSRALVWVYDASGVKSLKGLTTELRALTAQTFSEFKSEFLSILGVAGGKTLERAVLDPANLDNPLAIQRKLASNPKNLPPEAISNESALCVAGRKFSAWQKMGLKESDQKSLLLIGGQQQLTAEQSKLAKECSETLRKLNVRVFQIVFARPETFQSRQWLSGSSPADSGARFRVVDIPGASRAIQAVLTTLDREYIVTFQLPQNPSQSNQKLVLKANYHGLAFQSESQALPNPVSKPIPLEANYLKPLDPQSIPPQRFITLNRSDGLIFEAWLEWLTTAIIIGIAVTLLHIRRLRFGTVQINEGNSKGDTSLGPLLVLLNGTHKGREYRICKTATMLGSGWNCDVRLRAMRVKRQHGCLEIQGDKAILRDLSEGELYVNGRPFQSLRVIGHGSVIRIGDLQILFQCGEL